MKPKNEVFQLGGRELLGDAYDDDVLWQQPLTSQTTTYNTLSLPMIPRNRLLLWKEVPSHTPEPQDSPKCVLTVGCTRVLSKLEYLFFFLSKKLSTKLI